MKFSFKRGGGDKGAKAAKRVARAGGQDSVTAAKTFLLNHLEKLLLTAIALVALLIVYSGWKKDRLQSSPEDLRRATQSARSRIDESTWAEVRQDRQPEADTFNQRATADTVAINDENFPLPMPFHPILKERQKRRSDPQFIAPLELEVGAGYGPLAVRPDDSTDAGMSGLFRSSGSSEESRPLPNKYTDHRPGEMLTGASPTESAFFVSVTGLVPIKQQFEAYREAFEGAAEYLPERDTPNYLALNIQRAEVGADGQPGEWTDLNALKEMRLEPTRWEGQMEERASSDYIIRSLVMPLPPIKFRNVSQWALHSKIPEQRFGSGAYSEPTRTEGAAPDAPATDGSIDLFGGVGRSGEGRVSEMSGTMESDATRTSDDAAFANQPKIDYALLRYFDFTVEPGRSYAYRVQLILEDPNNPRESARPSTSACETSVVVRRQTNPRKNWIETPWSEPSRPITVPSGNMILAGQVEQPRMAAISVGNRRIRLTRRPGDEPDASVMAVVWDPNRAMDVPATISVRRGSVINGVVTTEAINPAQSNVVKLENYDLKTNTLVLDIAGGEVLDSAGRLRAPGMILLMNANGQLVFHHQVADFDQYDYFSIPEDEDLALERERDRAIEAESEQGRRGRRGENLPPEGRGR